MNSWKSAAKVISLVIAIAAVSGLIYANFYAPRYSEKMFIAAAAASVIWWLVTFQLLTDGKPGVLTSKVDKTILTAHAQKLQAEASVHLGKAQISTAKTSEAKAEYALQEAHGNFTRGQLLAEALHENQLLITRRATDMGVAVQDYTQYLLKTLEEKVKYETAIRIAETELQKERLSIEQTLKFTLTESSLRFEDRMRLIDHIAKVNARIKQETDRKTKRLLQEELSTLQAQLNALKQSDISKNNGA